MKRVLIVDDDRQVLDLVQRWLSAAGYKIETAADFAQATARLASGPDVLIVDVRLHEFNGIQLAVRARALHPQIRIVVMSAWDDPVLTKEAEAAGAVFLGKPFDEAQLLQALQ